MIGVRGLDTFLSPAPSLVECLASAPSWYLATVGTRIDAGMLPAVLEGLDPEEKTALWLTGTLNAGRGVPVEQCWSALAELTGQRHRRFQPVLDSLRRKGLVFVGHSNYRSVYFIPGDLRRAVEDVFFRPIVAHCSLPEEACRPLLHQASAVRDMQLFLLEVARREIHLTQRGDIHRREQLRLARLLRWPTWGPPDRRVPRQDFLVARLSLLWEYALTRRLAEDHAGTAVLTPAVEEWLDLSWGERWVDMLEYTLDWSRNWHPTAFTMLQVLCWAPAGRWVVPGHWFPRPPEDAGRRDAGVRPHIAVHSPAGGIGPHHSLHQWLHRLEYLGLVERAEDGGTTLLPVRSTTLGKAYLEALFGHREGVPAEFFPADEQSFIVAPNFEVVVPFSIRPRLLLELGMFSELAQADQALLFRISRNSVYRALQVGMDGQTILGVLARGSEHPLPENVVASIREWAAAYGKVWLARFCLLRCADAQVAAHLKASPRLRPFLAGELTPCDLILCEGDLGAVRAILEKEGYLPRAQVEIAPPVADVARRDGQSREERDPAVGAAAGAPRGSARRSTESQPPIRIIPSDWLDLAGRP